MSQQKPVRRLTPKSVLIFLAIAVVGAVAAIVFHLQQKDNGAEASGAGDPAPAAGWAPTLFQPEMFFSIGTLLLFIALIYGAWQYHTRNKRNDKVTEAATRKLYDNPDHYSSEQEDFQKQIRP